MKADSESSVKLETPYPPPLSATVPCSKCDGTGERRGPYADKRCLRCHGSGTRPRKHYAYCRRVECPGCLPTIDEIDAWPNILDVWAEQLARCIPQSPETSTHEGAVAAIRECDGWYGTTAFFARRYNLLIESLRPMLDGCAHDFDPECARCETMTPVREAIREADA